MAEPRARGWSLRSFLDSLTLELDRVQNTLAVKSVNRRLTYAVRDLSVELQLFPQFDGEEIRFTTARPGESGAARLAFQLGSITDRQIREMTADPPTRDDVSIEVVDGLDPDTRKSLERIGVSSLRDLERMERQNIDIGKASDNRIDYGRLAHLIQRTRRRELAPTVRSAGFEMYEGEPVLTIEGEHLVPAPVGEFPRAELNDEEVPVRSASDGVVRIAVDERRLHAGANTLRVALDPYAVLRMNLRQEDDGS